MIRLRLPFRDLSVYFFLALVCIPMHALLARQAQVPIAVMEFEGRGISEIESGALTDRLRNELVRLGSYDVLERAMMVEILREQDFQMTGCISSECLVSMGRLLGSKFIVGGSYTKVGNVYIISARMVDVETGKITNVSDFDLEGSLTDVLNHAIPAVAAQVSGEDVPDAEYSQKLNALMEQLEETQSRLNQLGTASVPAPAPATSSLRPDNYITIIGESVGEKYYQHGRQLKDWRLTGVIFRSGDMRAIGSLMIGNFLSYSGAFFVIPGISFFLTGIIGFTVLGEVDEGVGILLGGGVGMTLGSIWALKVGSKYRIKAVRRYNEVITQ